MDATDEFRFINTTAVPSSSTSSSRRTRKGGSHAEDGAPTTSTSASSTNSLRTVPVCVYNENRSFKLRFFWDKAFKLFHSHRPVYRAVSGINYQDCGTIGGAGSTAPDGTSLVKLRSQSHQQLNRIVPLNGEMDFSQFRNHNGRKIAHPASTAGTTSRILHSTVSSASAKNSRKTLFYDDTNVDSQTAADFIPVVVPRKKNRAFGGGDGGSADCSPIYTSPKKHQLNTHSSSGKPASNTLVNSSGISGGEKPQQRNSNDNFDDVDDDEQESSCFFYYNNANGEYDNVQGIHVNNHHHNNTTSCSTTVFPQSTTIRGSAKATHLHTANTNSHVILPSHNTTNNHHHHRSNVSATLSAQSSSSSAKKASASSSSSSSSQRGAPVQLRRTQSSKSHHSSNETQQRHYCNNNSNNHLKSASATATISSLHHPHHHRENKSLLLTSSSQKHHQPRNVPSPTCSAYESWKSSSAGSSSTKSKRNRNCEGQGGEGEDSSDTIGNDSGLDTWKRKKIGEGGIGCGSEVVNSGESSQGIVCTISQTIPFHNRPNNIHSDEEGENDYATVASEEEDYEEVGGGSEERDLDSIEPVQDQDKMRMMIENGSVMYDSLDDDTYSVVLPRMAPPSSPSINTNTAGSSGSSGSSVNGNTTVVLINSCCDDVSTSTTPDHCQNPVNLNHQNNSSQSDTFNFSDYDVECMSEIDLNSEPGESSAASVVVEEENGGGANGGGGESVGGPMKYLICHSTSENELDSLDLAMFERKQREAASLIGASAAGLGAVAAARLNGESCLNLLNGTGSNLFSSNKKDDDRNSSLCAEAGGIMAIHLSNNNTSKTTIKEVGGGGGGGDTAQQIHLLGQKYYGVGNSDNENGTCSSTKSAPSTITTHAANSSKSEEIYSNWSDAGSEFEFVAGPTAAAAAAGISTGSSTISKHCFTNHH